MLFRSQLVHMTGFVRTSSALSDPDFGFTPPNILKLRREVEMFQWHEKIEEDRRDRAGGSQEITRTVRYYTNWSSQLVDSGSFEEKGHHNPGRFPLEGYAQSGFHMNLERQIVLSDGVMNAIGGYQDYRPEQRLPGYRPVSGTAYYYNGADYDTPQGGDVRIRYSVVPEGVFSLIGRYDNQALHSYIHKDQSLALATPGVVKIGRAHV